MAISWVTISYLAKLETYFGKYFIVLGNFSLFYVAKFWKIIQPSGHTGGNLSFILVSFPSISIDFKVRLLPIVEANNDDTTATYE